MDCLKTIVELLPQTVSVIANLDSDWDSNSNSHCYLYQLVLHTPSLGPNATLGRGVTLQYSSPNYCR